MTYYQLFKLADFLSANEASTVFVELEEETSFTFTDDGEDE